MEDGILFSERSPSINSAKVFRISLNINIFFIYQYILGLQVLMLKSDVRDLF